MLQKRLSGRHYQALRVFFVAAALTALATITPQLREVEFYLYDLRMKLWQVMQVDYSLDSRIRLFSLDDLARADGWDDQATLEALNWFEQAGVTAVVISSDNFFSELGEVRAQLQPNVLVLGEQPEGKKLLFSDLESSAELADWDGIVRSLPVDHPGYGMVRGLVERLGVSPFDPASERLFLEFEPTRDLSGVGETSKLEPMRLQRFLENVREDGLESMQLKGTIVFLGTFSQQASVSELKTPFGDMQPMQLYAVALNTFLDRWNLSPVGPFGSWMLTLLLLALTCLSLSGRRPLRVALGGLGMLAGVSAFSFCLLPYQVDLPVARIGFSLIVAIVSLIFLEFRRTRKVLEMYGGTEDASAAAEETNASICFTILPKFLFDLEKRGDENLLEYRANYTNLLFQIAKKYHGRVLDFQGDAQMIGFGLRLDDDDEHSAEATAAALEIVSSVPFLAEVWNCQPEDVKVHAGVCTGPLAWGHVVASGKQDVAAIGDTTNTAARLMGAAMKLDLPVVVAKTTFEAGKGLISGPELEPVELKGKTAPVEVFAAESVDEEWRQANIKNDKESITQGGTIAYTGERKGDLWATLVSAGIGLVTLLVPWKLSFTETIETYTYDKMVSAFAQVEADPRIVIAGIDEESVSPDYLGPYPWSRYAYAQVIENLRDVGYKGLFLDIFFRKSSDPEGDEAFAEALMSEPRVVIAATLPYTDDTQYLKDPLLFPSVDGLELWKRAQIGLAHKRLDTDKHLRWAMMAHPETASGENRLYPSAAVALLMDSSEQLKETPDGIQVGDRVIPSLVGGARPNELLIRWGPIATSRNAPQSGSYRYIPFWRLVNPGDPIHKELEGAYILAGWAFRQGEKGLLDNVGSPVGLVKGVEAHARILDTLLNENYLKQAPSWFAVLWVLTLVALTTYILAFYRAAKDYLPRLVALVTGAALTYALALTVFGVWIPIVFPLFGVAWLFGAVLLGRYLLTFNALTRFIPEEFADEILFHHGVKNRRLVATVLLTDIRGYTTLSEGRSAVGMLDVLNEYHKRTVACYERHGGKALTYQGDAQIVVFGVFGRRENPARDAVAAALELQSICDKLREEWEIESRDDFDVGAGLCTGEVEVGKLGSGNNLQISVVGETVRQTHKVQALSADLEAPVLLDEPTFQACRGEVTVDDLGMILPKGLTREIRLYRAVKAEAPKA